MAGSVNAVSVPTTADFDDVLNNLPPNIPANNPGLQQLLSMRQASRVQAQPYVFPVSFINLAASATSQGNFLVDTSAPFMLTQGVFQAWTHPAVNNNAVTVPPITVQIQDQQTNRNWQSAAVPVNSIFGHEGGLPFFYPQARLIAANTNVIITVTNLDATNAYDLYLNFVGWRYYAS